MSELLRPFADLDGVFASVEYRSNLMQSFEKLDVEDDSVVKIVIVDDLRTVPTHQFRIKINQDCLKIYAKHRDKLRFLILVRDNALRRELKLADYPIDGLPDIIDLNRKDLSTTSLKTDLPLTFSVISVDVLKGNAAFPVQKASRLAEIEVRLKNSAGGASFPFRRKTAEEFKNAGLPGEAGLRLVLEGDPSELVEKVDTPIQNLLSIWVHEKVWQAIQRDQSGSPAAAQMRIALVTMTATQMLLGAAAPCLKEGKKIEEDSVVGQLLSYLEKQASLPDGHLLKLFEDEQSVLSLDPYIQNAWRFVASAAKEEEESLA